MGKGEKVSAESVAKGTRTRWAAAGAGLILALCVVGSGCGGSDSSGGGKLALVAYSTPQEAYAKLISAFQKTPTGEGVGFSKSFGASGDQRRAVEAGLPADVVAFSLAPDVDGLVEKKLVSADWAKDRFDGFVTDSVVVFAVRKRNPKNIRTWDDLVKPGVEVLTPNPFTSGGARWNLMAAYGAQLKQGKTAAQANAYLGKLLGNVPVQDKSAREALQTFAAGKGDVLLAYENEAITVQQKGQEVDYVIPDETILIENPIAVTAKSRTPKRAKAFVDFARSAEGQRIFAEAGYRPVLESVLDEKRFPRPADLFRIGFVGGWSKVNDRFFDPEKGIVAEIEEKLGVSTEK
jgi:sulfate/thiosulfate transport system substrate-binding protein